MKLLEVPISRRIRALADEAWANGDKQLSGMLHDAARAAEALEAERAVTI